MYQPSQAGAGTMRASEIAITISATSIWNPALQHAHLSTLTCACSGAQQHRKSAITQAMHLHTYKVCNMLCKCQLKAGAVLTVEMQTAAALQPSSRRPVATHVLVSSMRILLFRGTLARLLQVHVSREDITNALLQVQVGAHSMKRKRRPKWSASQKEM